MSFVVFLLSCDFEGKGGGWVLKVFSVLLGVNLSNKLLDTQAATTQAAT